MGNRHVSRRLTIIYTDHHLWAGSDDDAIRLPALFAQMFQKLGGTATVVTPKIGIPIDIG